MFVRDIPISNGKVPMSLEITGFGLHASASSEASGGVLLCGLWQFPGFTDFCWTVKCSGLEKCTFCGFWVKGGCAICSHSFTILVLMDPQILVICGIKHAFLGYNHIEFWPIAIQWIVDSCRFFSPEVISDSKLQIQPCGGWHGPNLNIPVMWEKVMEIARVLLGWVIWCCPRIGLSVYRRENLHESLIFMGKFHGVRY